MIIRKVNIISFGGIKDRIIEFDQGINLIYGENESGKSTIQSFIKIWLYGFTSSRVKDMKSNERLKFTPISGGIMAGELVISHDGKTYTISRTFGKTKKEDTCEIFNTVTGEVLRDIPIDEPGKYFLNVNRSTFVKTLFIGQLQVGIKKDKEEELLDKISNTVATSDGDVTIDKAFSKLDNFRRSMSNNRKSGELDKLKDKYNELISERYEGYLLSEENLGNEELLISLKDEKEKIESELKNLEVYKKYLKKVKLQKEYEELTEYLLKKQELEEEGKNLEDSLRYNDEEITIATVDDLKEDYSIYLSLEDIRNEDELKLMGKRQKLMELEGYINKYGYMPTNSKELSNNLVRIKLEQDTLREQIQKCESILREISELVEEKNKARKSIVNVEEIKNIREEAINTLETYENKLKLLKFAIENSQDIKKTSKSKNFKRAILVLIIISSLIAVVTISNVVFKIIIPFVALGIIFLILSNDFINKPSKNLKEGNLEDEIHNMEEKLDSYNTLIGVSDYGQLLRQIRMYDRYVEAIENIDVKIREKQSQIEILNLNDLRKRYINNKDEVEELFMQSGVGSINELIEEVHRYDELDKEIAGVKLELKSLEENYLRIVEQIALKENKMDEKLLSIGIKCDDFINLSDIIIKLKDKINKRDEILRSLHGVNETYGALIKDKDIAAIRDELKDVISLGIKYSYEKEEEIDEVVKDKSIRLLEVVKDINAVENKISNRFIGKRMLPKIEEHIELIQSEIVNKEKKFRAANLASELLQESYEEIRESFGPVLNSNVMKSFREFTSEKYSEVMVSDKYEMKVVSNNQTLSADLLSNGANDQLYFSLRLAFIKMIFNEKNITLYLDEPFLQYDDKRLKNIMKYIDQQQFSQVLIFTCQERERNVLKDEKIKFNYKIL